MEELIKHYSEEDTNISAKLTFAPHKQYFQNKDKNGYTNYPEYHHSTPASAPPEEYLEPVNMPGIVNQGDLIMWKINLSQKDLRIQRQSVSITEKNVFYQVLRYGLV